MVFLSLRIPVDLFDVQAWGWYRLFLMENDMEEVILDRAKNSPIKRVWMLQHFESPPDDSDRDLAF